MLQKLNSSQEDDQINQRPNGGLDMDEDPGTFHHYTQSPLSRQSSSDLMIKKDPVKGESKTRTGFEVSIGGDGRKDEMEGDRNGANSLLTSSWLKYAGHCPGLDSFLQSKHGIFWAPAKFVDALFRGVSQVVFANNPITGLLITLALFWSDWIVGSAAVGAAAVAILTGFFIGQQGASIQAGLTTYSAVLVGCVTASIWKPVYGEPVSVTLWVFITVGAMLSVFLTSALANMLSSFKIPLPCLTMPFNIVNLLLFTCFMPPIHNPLPLVQQLNGTNATKSMLEHNKVSSSEHSSTAELNYAKVFTGIICSMGQIYGVENIFASVLMYVGVIIYSPILCLMAFVGASVGTLCGLVFVTGPAYTTIYTGIWGYNTILSSTAIGGLFITINWLSFCTAIANVIFTVIIQQGLIVAFHNLRLPVFTLPFELSTLLFLSVNSTSEGLTRVTNITFPEMHRFEYTRRLEEKAKAQSRDRNTDLVEVIGNSKTESVARL